MCYTTGSKKLALSEHTNFLFALKHVWDRTNHAALSLTCFVLGPQTSDFSARGYVKAVYLLVCIHTTPVTNRLVRSRLLLIGILTLVILVAHDNELATPPSSMTLSLLDR